MHAEAAGDAIVEFLFEHVFRRALRIGGKLNAQEELPRRGVAELGGFDDETVMLSQKPRDGGHDAAHVPAGKR